MSLSRDGLTLGCSPLTKSSAVVAAASAVAALPAVAAKVNYLDSISIFGAGATVGAIVNVTVEGVLGGTITIPLAVPAGALVGLVPVQINFKRPLQAADVNTAITVTVPSFGVGNTAASVLITGFLG